MTAETLPSTPFNEQDNVIKTQRPKADLSVGFDQNWLYIKTDPRVWRTSKNVRLKACFTIGMLRVRIRVKWSLPVEIPKPRAITVQICVCVVFCVHTQRRRLYSESHRGPELENCSNICCRWNGERKRNTKEKHMLKYVKPYVLRYVFWYTSIYKEKKSAKEKLSFPNKFGFFKEEASLVSPYRKVSTTASYYLLAV